MIESFTPQTTRKPWGDEILVAQGPGYTGKVLKRYSQPPFHRAGLQYHTTKTETFHLYSGMAWVYFLKPDAEGKDRLCKLLLQPGASIHVPAGVIHSVQTQGDSVMFEAAEYAPDSETVNVEAEWDVAQAVEVQRL